MHLPKLIKVLFFLTLIVLGVFLVRGNKEETFQIVLTESGFDPLTLTVPQGSSIVFTTNTGRAFWPASESHPLHDKYPKFDPQKPINADESWVFKAQEIGEWGFHDHLFFTHRGKITVLAKMDWEARNKVLTREEISKRIDRQGPEKSYAQLKRVSDSSSASTHSTFHIFGEVLYQKIGVVGIAVCDEFAGFGCYHGFFIEAVSDKGIEVVGELEQKCVEKFGVAGLGCPHGIGHGLVEFLGYDKLNEALVICSELSWQGELFGCQGGVLMEYNFRTTFREGESIISTREAHGNLYEPCRSVEKKFRQACYFEQASWWNEVLNSDYAKIGTFCAGLIGHEKDSCLLGLGDSVAERSAYDKEIVVKACLDMPGSYEEAICRTGAAWAFFANPEKLDQSEKICEGLGSYQNLCLEKRILVK